MKRCPELYLFALYIVYNINTLYNLELSLLCHFLRRVGERTLRFWDICEYQVYSHTSDIASGRLLHYRKYFTC
jgi:hypothetical protein